MSREIKFRHWCDEWFAKPNRYAYSDEFYDLGEFFEEFRFTGTKYEFEQYTGLKDKNGKEIYEGDIVRCYSRKKLLGEYQVIWNEDCGGFECESLRPLVDGGDGMLKDVRVFNEMSTQFRVIGNIHENPELVGGEK